MISWDWIARRVRVWFRKNDEERELDDEMQFHLAMEARQLEEAGLDPAEARRRARLDFGGVEGVKEQVRDVRGGRFLEDLVRDLRLALRTLPRQPTFFVAVLAILGIGIGANVAMLSVLDASLLRGLPYPQAEELVMGQVVWDGDMGGPVSGPDFFDYREQARAMESVAAFTGFPLGVTAAGGDAPERVRAPLVSTDFFHVLGVDPIHGRSFADAEGELGGGAVVMLSHGYWQRRFGGATSALGSTLTLDGQPHTVIGVMPPGFHFFMDADVWRPLERGGDWAQARQFHNFLLVGRLARGSSIAVAQDEADRISTQLADLYPDSNRDKGLGWSPLRTALTEDYRTPLALLTAAVLLLLVVTCANSAGLLVARGEARRSEITIRLAMGAGRGRLVRQLLAESSLLALCGAVVGLLAAGALRQAILGVLPLERLGDLEATSLSSTMAFAAGLGLVTLVLFGVLPAFRIARLDPAEDLRGARSSDGHKSLRLRNTLVVGQVALTAVLLVGTGLLLRSLEQVRSVDTGFNPRGLLTAEVQLPAWEYQDVARRAQLFARLTDRIAAVPAVAAVGMANRLPIRDTGGNVRVAPLSEWQQQGVFERLAYQRMVLPGYFAAMEIPLLSGRDVRLTDDRTSTNVVALGGSLAEDLFPGENPLGRIVGIDVGEPEPWQAEVVGVVGDVTPTSLAEGIDHIMYFSYVQRSPSSMRLVVRAREAAAIDPASADLRALIVPAIREAIAELDPNLPLSGIATYDEMLASSLADRRAIVTLLLVFSLVTLLLSAVGLYGVLAYQVSRRTREIGVRLAVGASGSRVAAWTLRVGLTLVAFGLAVGLPVAWAAGRGLEGMLFGIGTADPVTYLAVVAFLGGVALVACWLPARRAARINPVEAFRAN